MPTHFNQPLHVEGAWEDLLRRPERFAGRRVRVTVLDEPSTEAALLRERVQRWIAEADALMGTPVGNKPDAFTDALVEKYRRQGLVF